MTEKRIIVFAGPTSVPLPFSDYIELRPPVAYGDLSNIDDPQRSIIVIVDAAFFHKPGPTHPELLRLLNNGTTLIGAASFGALRATELAPLGMIGIGKVYSAIVHRIITDDAELAVAMRSDNFKAVSIPLINVRKLLFVASTKRVDYAILLRAFEVARRIHFMERTSAVLKHEWHQECRAISSLLAELLSRPEMIDVKSSDASQAVRFALSLVTGGQSVEASVLPDFPTDLFTVRG